ncbi:MAG TPA: tetratricopeptide repeat protein, partial [Candidatus Korarchaeota archaeon]|nr:tetratricopeptide repeat protein [Candidatus Korarchaeota archaeon]
MPKREVRRLAKRISDEFDLGFNFADVERVLKGIMEVLRKPKLISMPHPIYAEILKEMVKSGEFEEYRDRIGFLKNLEFRCAEELLHYHEAFYRSLEEYAITARNIIRNYPEMIKNLSINALASMNTSSKALVRLIGEIIREAGEEQAKDLLSSLYNESIGEQIIRVNEVGVTSIECGEFRVGQIALSLCLELCQRLDYPGIPSGELTAMTLNNLGNLLSDMGRLDEAKGEYERALKLYEELLS